MTFYDRLVERVARARPGAWLVVRVLTHLDRRLVRWTHGRLSTTLGTRFHRSTVLVTTIGATTGLERTVPLLATPDGDRLVLVASSGGDPRHPAWYRNLEKSPHCRVLRDGRWRDYEAREAEGDERERLWALAVSGYSGFAAYQARVARRIPVMVLAPADATPSASATPRANERASPSTSSGSP